MKTKDFTPLANTCPTWPRGGEPRDMRLKQNRDAIKALKQFSGGLRHVRKTWFFDTSFQGCGKYTQFSNELLSILNNP